MAVGMAHMRKFFMTLAGGLLAAAVLCGAVRAHEPVEKEPWEILPPTPQPVATQISGYAPVNGVELYYAVSGQGEPVLLLHGGLANSDYWGNQVEALSRNHKVIVMDSRGHGRSTRDVRPYSYDLMADDVVALLDYLKLEKADIIGWSDGGIIGLDMGMRYPQRTAKIFAFGANTKTSGLKENFDQDPTFSAFIKRAGGDYERLSKTPKDYAAFLEQIGHMWEGQPNWSDEDLRRIGSKVWIVDGDHDEGIRLDHTAYMAATIPHAGLLILPQVSHFAFMQDPELFNAAVLRFLDGK